MTIQAPDDERAQKADEPPEVQKESLCRYAVPWPSLQPCQETNLKFYIRDITRQNTTQLILQQLRVSDLNSRLSIWLVRTTTVRIASIVRQAVTSDRRGPSKFARDLGGVYPGPPRHCDVSPIGFLTADACTTNAVF